MKKSKICNITCIILMAVILILQFMPFWSYDGMSTSIQAYIWYPSDHAPLETYLAGEIDGYTINNILIMPILVLVTSVAGIVLCLIKSGEPWSGLLPLVCGIAGLWGYLFKPAYRLGGNWVLHLIVCIALAVVAALRIYFQVKEEAKEEVQEA